ncbi:MAG TPA: hypothetical protein VJT72_02785 [Pseudonocardiaceae bacterium]|nr:hypothetical protein [Pseudonocardiaceae bacterium]
MTKLWDVIRRRRVLAIVIGVLVLVGLTSGVVVGRGILTPEAPAKAANSSMNAIPADFTAFRNDQAGFELAYPTSWSKLTVQDPQVHLLVAQGTEDSLLVRSLELQQPVGPQQLATAKQLTDQIVASNKTVQMITEPKQIELGGLPGFFYFYSFKDPGSEQEGAHSHYFLFNGKMMISLVFQALPKDHFPVSAPTFDKITSTFHGLKK